MPEPLSIAADHESVEVDLWGALYYTQRITRSRAKEITRLEQAAQEIDGNDTLDEQVKLLAELLDQILEPAEGKRKKASAHILAKWEQDALTYEELTDFIDRVAEAGRPT